MALKIKIEEANLISAKSASKRPEIDSRIGQYLLDSVKGNNDTLSKSIVTYELLLYSGVIPFEDNITKLEQNLNSQLENNGINPNDVDDYNIKDVDIYSKYDYPEGSTNRMQVTFPQPVFDSVDWERKWAAHITEAVEYYLVRQFDSRQHRIDVKTDILGLVTGSENKSDCSDLACEMFDSIQSESDYVIDSPDSLATNANLCKTVDDKKELLKVYYDEYPMQRSALVNKFIDAFEYSDIYRAHKIFNEFVLENELYEYSDTYMRVGSIDTMEYELSNIKSHDEIDMVFVKMIESYVDGTDSNRVFSGELIDLAKSNKIINKSDDKIDLMKYIKNVDEKYDTSISYFENSFIYFD